MRSEIFDLNLTALDLGVTEHEAHAGTQRVCAPQHALHRATATVQIRADAGGAQLARETERDLQAGRTEWRNEAARRLLRRRQRRGEQQPLEPDREAYGRQLWAAQLVHHAVVAATTEQRILRAELALVRHQLEQCARVVIEPAHQARRDGVLGAERVERCAKAVPVRAIVGLQTIQNRRRVGDGFAVARILRIQDAERVVLQPLLRVLAELVSARRQVSDQRFAVLLACAGAADRVDPHFHVADAQLAQ